ncbi:MAG TPA: monovalent cation/H(+) antiporter subunit G [Acidimicrobiales bacterium]|nr:monovalent cation/H(+) antiporter subunit G [Acidimicrobiales bacterium]
MIADAFVAAGTAVIVAASVAALVARDSFVRLHLAAPMTSLGGPLIAAGLCIANGVGLTTASIAFHTALLFIVGPMLSSAIARMLAQRTGKTSPESPE